MLFSLIYSESKDGKSHVRGKTGQLECKNGEVCHWLIQVSQGQKVHFTFSTFVLREETDRVDIFDGQNEWKPFVSFTKKLRPRAMVSTGHFVRIIASGHVVLKFKQSRE